MSPFWQAFWGGVLGKIAGAIFIAACVVMWLGPEDWINWFVSDLPVFFTPAVARWIFLGLGVIVLLWMVCPLISRWAPGTKENDYMPLEEAARQAYEETEGTFVGYAAEFPAQDQGRRSLSWFARALAGNNQETPIFGKSPPSRIRRRIPDWELRQCDFSDDVRALIRHTEVEPKFVDLEIKKSDFLARLREIKNWNPSDGTW